ncbi:MAG: hypothetical protein BGO55_28750 [Sphingobacteriales bacterium 50-39]|nr:MAG: hypothetical protein BGO55_28750 [Sphingobacteriales bacterium 50-39]
MPFLTKVDKRFQSCNVQMAEVIGGQDTSMFELRAPPQILGSTLMAQTDGRYRARSWPIADWLINNQTRYNEK